MSVRDPSGVRMEIDSPEGPRTVLPPGATAAEIPLPDSTPPFEGGLHQKTVVRRLPAGPIEIACDKCSPDVKTLVPMNGRLTLGESFQVAKFDFTRSEMRVHFTDVRTGEFNTMASYDADVVTPWTNVSEVRRVSTPDRGFGFKLLLSAAIGAVLGGFALVDGVADHREASTIFAAVLLPISGILGIGGSWYVLAPSREQVFFTGSH